MPTIKNPELGRSRCELIPELSSCPVKLILLTGTLGRVFKIKKMLALLFYTFLNSLRTAQEHLPLSFFSLKNL